MLSHSPLSLEVSRNVITQSAVKVSHCNYLILSSVTEGITLYHTVHCYRKCLIVMLSSCLFSQEMSLMLSHSPLSQQVSHNVITLSSVTEGITLYHTVHCYRKCLIVMLSSCLFSQEMSLMLSHSPLSQQVSHNVITLSSVTGSVSL